MTKHTRRNQRTDVQASEPQADGFSWSESQTGTSSRLREPREPDDGGVDHTVTMLDDEGSPLVTATGEPERATRAPRPEI